MKVTIFALASILSSIAALDLFDVSVCAGNPVDHKTPAEDVCTPIQTGAPEQYKSCVKARVRP